MYIYKIYTVVQTICLLHERRKHPLLKKTQQQQHNFLFKEDTGILYFCDVLSFDINKKIFVFFHLLDIYGRSELVKA